MRNTHYPSPEIAGKIQQIFDEHGLTDSQVAKEIGMERKAVIGYRTCVRNPSIPLIRYLCATYHVSADWLLDLGGDRDA